MTTARPLRSALYLPASNARAVEKARTLPADAVIFDLEDAVAPDAKAEARRQAVEAVRTGGFGRRLVVVRVNGLETPWGEIDLAALAAAPPDVVLAPKVSAAQDVLAYRRMLNGPALWVMVETCRAVLNLASIAETTGVSGLVIGTNDLAKEMRCRPGTDRAPLHFALAASVTAGRANGLAVLDGVFNGIGDEAGFEAECRQALAFGFDGKTLIHPSQVEPCNRVFAPSQAEVAWARTVADAFELPDNLGKGVLQVEGRMVERLHLDEARRVLALAEALEA